jgi:hypothetical protein
MRRRREEAASFIGGVVFTTGIPIIIDTCPVFLNYPDPARPTPEPS